MIKLIRFLLGLCNHKHENIETREICRYIEGKEEVVGYFTLAVCSLCGHTKMNKSMLNELR